MRENEIICSHCGAVLTEDEAHEFDGLTLCDQCFDELTTTCDNCGDTIWRDNASGGSGYTLCNHCYEYHYCSCEDCGRLIHNDDAYYDEDSDYPYCRDCYEKLNDMENTQ